MASTLEDLLALGSLRRSVVTVAGQSVHIRELSVEERAAIVALQKTDEAKLGQELVRFCVTDASGAPLFAPCSAEDEARQRARIGAMRPAIVDQIALEIMALSGLSDDPKKD